MDQKLIASNLATVAPLRAPSPVIGRRSSTPTATGVSKMNSNNSFNNVNRHVNGYTSVMGYPNLYEPAKSVNAGVNPPGPTGLPPPPPPAPHYFNNIPGIGYNTPSLAHLHQYLVAAHLAHPLRNVPLPVHSNNSSPVYKDMDPVALAAELDRKRKRSDSGIEDSTTKFVTDPKLGRYQQNDAITTGHQSPAEIEKVKKILETVNANVTRQLLEASVQRVKNVQNGHYVHHPLSSSPHEKHHHDYSEGKISLLLFRLF